MNSLRGSTKLSASILSADFGRLGEEVKDMENAGVDYIHVDVMDGHFVPNLTIGPMVVKAIAQATSLPLDVHLMIENPDRLIPEFIQAGSHMITVHAEATCHIHRTLMEIKNRGCKAGVSINPGSPLCLLDPILDSIDLALIMTVNPGFGGQTFIPGMLGKIERLRRQIDESRRPIELFVDGGINLENIAQIAKAGADVIIMGSALFKADDYRKAVSALRAKMRGVA
jgi:ribulose-phosphate 3-epimerase